MNSDYITNLYLAGSSFHFFSLNHSYNLRPIHALIVFDSVAFTFNLADGHQEPNEKEEHKSKSWILIADGWDWNQQHIEGLEYQYHATKLLE